MGHAEPEGSTEFQRFLASLGTLVETHASWVVLTADEAIKFKKPVDLGFLDFSSRAKREEFCRAELELNRRLAPTVYRTVIPVWHGPRGYVLGDAAGPADGLELVDHAVVMRRLAEHDRADVLLAEGRLSAELVRRLAARLTRFHRELRAETELAHFGSVASLGRNVRENWSELEGCAIVAEEVWAPVSTAQARFLAEHGAYIDERCQQGHVKDGHGDLRLEHVYFEGDDLAIVDCIEFSDRFRYADTALDIAFLSMDLRHAGRPDLAEDFLAEVAHMSGDFDAYRVVDFYESYRATVRGKVAAFRALQCEGTRAQAQEHEAVGFFAQALQALAGERERPRARLICMGGLIASGKSTLSRRLGQALHAPVIDSDGTRKRAHGVDVLTSLADEPFAGAYSPDATERTYDLLERGARAVLESGRTVIVDASFRSRALRARFSALARALGVPHLLLECHAPSEVIAERLSRRARGPSRSDGQANMLGAFVAAWEPISAGEADRVLRCDTSQPGEAAYQEAWQFVRR